MNSPSCVTCGATEDLTLSGWSRVRLKCGKCKSKPTASQVVVPSTKVSKAWLELEKTTRERIIAKYAK